MQPLISLLDGSNDFNSESEEQAFNLEIQKAKEDASNIKGTGKSFRQKKPNKDNTDRYKSSEINFDII